MTSNEAEVTLELQHVFGSLCGSSLREAAVFADGAGQQIAFAVGRQLAIRHVENNETSFLGTGARIDMITACAVSTDRSLMVVAEKCSNEARISIYDLKSGSTSPMKTMKPLSGALGSTRFVGVGFSPVPQEGGTPRYLCAVTAGSEATLVLMNWESEKILAKCKLPGNVDRLAFPFQHDRTDVTVSGPHMLRLLQIRHAKGEVTLKLMPAFSNLAEKAQKILDHTWLEAGRNLLGLCVQEGAVHILSADELIVLRTIDSAFGPEGDLEDVLPVCIRSFTQGFLLGGSYGYLAVWEESDDGAFTSVDRSEDSDGARRTPENEYKLAVALKVRPDTDSVCSIDVTPSEEHLLLGFGDAAMGIVPMASIYGTEDEQVPINISGNHSAAITAMDMAVHRSLVVTICKGDSSMRIWNWAARTCEIRSTFGGDPPIAVAVHPFGYYLALGFAEKLRFYHILVKDIKLHKEINLRGIGLLKFSHGGHLLAVTQGKSIYLYSVRTLEKITTLQGHSKEITCLSFDPEDHALWSVSQDGRLIQWNLATFRIECDHYETGTERLAVSAISPDQATCSVFRNGKQLLQRFSQSSLEYEVELESNVKVVTLYHHHGNSFFLTGTAKGGLQVYTSLPYQGTPKFLELALHGMACTAICISVDGRTLVSAGADGVIFVLGISGLCSPEELNMLPMALHQTDNDRFAQEAEAVLASKLQIQKLENKCQALMAEFREIKEKREREFAMHEEECAAQVAQARQKDQAQIQELHRRLGALEQAAQAKEAEGGRLMKNMEQRHAEALDQLTNLYNRKLCHESDRLLVLRMQREELQAKMVQEEEEHQQQMRDSALAAQEELSRLLAERDLEIKKHQDLLAFIQHRFEEVQQLTADNHDREVIRLKHHGWEALEEQKQVEEQLRKEQEKLQGSLEKQEKEREIVEERQQESNSTLRSLHEQAEELKRTLHGLHGERQDREATLQDKLTAIEGYKSKQKTLKKFKLLLDQKLAEVSTSLQPKDSLIKKLNQDLTDLETEFERQLLDHRQLEGQIAQRRQKAAILTQETEELKARVREKDAQIRRFTSDVHQVVTEETDLSVWPREIRRLYHQHIDGDLRGQGRLPLEDMMRQMRVVERQVTSLAAKGNQIRAMGKLDLQTKANENATLVQELNQLRVVKSSLQRKVRDLSTKLSHLAPEKAALKGGQAAAGLPAPPKPSQGAVQEPKGLPGPRQNTSSRELLLDDSPSPVLKPAQLAPVSSD
ncbi:Cfap57 [Symbiodinium natans]|uniref:Cfap57 protein n=1 Tax=Symbiodinium natans TaxID=878477 RepID=A0A812TZ37_9DINO|nr:Cfap57 [Symbiodinium natans]